MSIQAIMTALPHLWLGLLLPVTILHLSSKASQELPDSEHLVQSLRGKHCRVHLLSVSWTIPASGRTFWPSLFLLMDILHFFVYNKYLKCTSVVGLLIFAMTMRKVIVHYTIIPLLYKVMAVLIRWKKVTFCITQSLG